MHTINKETNIHNIRDMLIECKYDCKEVEDNAVIFELNGLRARVSMTSGKNLMFMILLNIKKDIPEIDILRKVNEVNYNIISGNFSYFEDYLLYCFSLIRPYGMGQKGFGAFVDYHFQLLPFTIENSNLNEITV
ncbi:hypothetical protein [Pantoea dispersa]|uniref:hypothetical protein n=1 Tax=Pantoea dispersa TaxID=59814 RepID=UPI001EE763A2|nr:hypothetical protein [Pantoea dispersa]UKY36465.1 hypothetical protein KFZ74_19680 [Pantoea dispersa]